MDTPINPRLLLLWNLYSTEFSEFDDVREDLKDMGYDPDSLSRNGRELLREVRGRLDLEMKSDRTIRRSEQVDRLRRQLRTKLGSEQNPKSALLAMLPQYAHEGQAVFFRKIESLSVEDALEILSDSLVLKIMEVNPDALEDDDTKERRNPEEQ